MTAPYFLAAGLLAGWLWEEREPICDWIDLTLDALFPPNGLEEASWILNICASDPEKDRRRLDKNAEALALAKAGDPFAIHYLRQRSGRFGTAEIAGYGAVGGWGSKISRADAERCWQEVRVG